MNVYIFIRNIQKDKNLDLENFDVRLKRHEKQLKIIHNKKSIEFQTLNEIYYLYTKKQPKYLFSNIIILVLEGNEKNRLSFINSVYTKLYKPYTRKMEHFRWNLLFNENLIDFFNNQNKINCSQTEHKKMKINTDVFCPKTKNDTKNFENANEELLHYKTILKTCQNQSISEKNDSKKGELLETNIENYTFFDDVENQDNILHDLFDGLKQKFAKVNCFFQKIKNIRSCFFYCPNKICTYNEINFFFEFKIYHKSKRYYKFNDKIQTNDTEKRYCYSIEFKFQNRNILDISIYAKTKIDDTFTIKSNKIILKETIYIFYDTINISYELFYFTYYVKTQIEFKQESSNTGINLSDIEFYKDSEHEYFKEKFSKNTKIEPNFNFMPIYNFIKNDEFDDMKKQNSVYYNDFISESSRSVYEALENIVVLDVSKLYNDEVIDGQKKITQFLIHLEKIVEYWNLKYNYLGLNRSIHNVNLTLDSNEKILCEKFKTNLSINDMDVLINIKKFLEESFKDSIISNEIYYNSKPIEYSKNYEFDSNFNLDCIYKQSFCIQSDSKRKKTNEIVTPKKNKLKQNYFLRFYYTLTTNIDNQKIILNAQFYYNEYSCGKFCKWINNIGFKNFLCDFYEIDALYINDNYYICKNMLCKYYNKNDTDVKYKQSFCANINCKFYVIKYLKLKDCQVLSTIYSIMNNFEIDFIFGLILCIKSSENILKGITYQYLISNNKLIKDIIESSNFFCPFFHEKFKDFEMTFLIYNIENIKILEEIISNKILLLKKIINDEKQKLVQDNNIKTTAENKIRSILKFQSDFLIIIANFNDLLFFMLKQFKKYLFNEKNCTLYCVLTTHLTEDIIDDEYKKKMDI